MGGVLSCVSCTTQNDVSQLPYTASKEIEAVEACKWLRAAGFPQYAQMYEDQQFPIDISSVEKDHDFLDKDSIQSLFRRLNTLNKCATMKIDAIPRKNTDDSDEEDQCALSDKWKFQRSSRRWSRKDLDVEIGNIEEDLERNVLRSSSSHDSLLTDNEESLSQQEDSPVLITKTSHDKLPSPSLRQYPSLSPSTAADLVELNQSPTSPTTQRAHEKFKGAKNFINKKMESFKVKKGKKGFNIPPDKIDKVEISGPVLVESPSVQERIDRLGCVDISPTSEAPKDFPKDLNDLKSIHSKDSSPSSELLKAKEDGSSDLKINSDSKASTHSKSLLSAPIGHRRNHSSSDIDEVFALGPDYKPGTFPKMVANGYVDVGHGNQINYRTGSFSLGTDASEEFRDTFLRREKSLDAGYGSSPNRGKLDKKSENRLSIYDNVPDCGSSEVKDPQKELDNILHDLLANIGTLNQCLGQEFTDETDLFLNTSEEIQDTDSTKVEAQENKMSPVPADLDSLTMTEDKQENLDQDVDKASASGSSYNHELSDLETTPESREGDTSDPPEMRERRDSGVGSSLTRAPSDRRRQRIRWHSFMKSHRPSLNSRTLQISGMSAGQLMILRKLSLLKITSLMEKYSPTNRTGFNWAVPKFIKRFKSPDYKDKQVFGVPLLVVLQRTGQPLPQCILYAMRSLRRTAKDAVGIFRKSGVRSRIQKLQNQIEINPEFREFDALQAYDVADLLKTYFRELPECLLTNKLSETFISTFTHVPSESRLEAIQAAIMLMPDENREVLQCLLLFLGDIAQHCDQNQMTASNLAVCFAPSLFHMFGPRSNPTASPKRNRKNVGNGLPDMKELLEQKAAHECLTVMIQECKKLFMIPEELLSKCRFSYIEQGDPVTIEELGKKRFDDSPADYTAYMESCIQGLLKESRDKFKGWVSIPSTQNTELAYKKVGDGHPLRLWKSSVEVEAPPVEVLNRILRERHLWDEDLLNWRTVEKVDKDSEIFQYVTNAMAPHPTHDFTELRTWRNNLPKGACVLVSTSVDHLDAPLSGGVKGVVLASRYLIEPCGSGKSRVAHICRVDIKGHTPEWYNKVYGHICANYMAKIRDSFKQTVDSDGPETKV